MPHYLIDESLNSSSSMDPVFINPRVQSTKTSVRTGAGCTGGPVSYQSSVRNEKMEHEYLVDNEDLYASGMSSSQLDIDEYKKMKKRVQNKESAIRSRMKKKAYYETIEVQFNNLQ
jgi:hypothetical protein